MSPGLGTHLQLEVDGPPPRGRLCFRRHKPCPSAKFCRSGRGSERREHSAGTALQLEQSFHRDDESCTIALVGMQSLRRSGGSCSVPQPPASAPALSVLAAGRRRGSRLPLENSETLHWMESFSLHAKPWSMRRQRREQRCHEQNVWAVCTHEHEGLPPPNRWKVTGSTDLGVLRPLAAQKRIRIRGPTMG